jgi:polar amino acid transport system substrate-binding protein
MILSSSYVTAIPSAEDEQVKQLHIAFSDIDHYPFEYINDAGELTGLHIEVIEHIAAKQNYHIKTYRLPWRRIQRMINSGFLDGASFIAGHKNSHKNVWFNAGNHLSVNAFYLMTRDDAPKIKFKGDLQALEGKTIAVLSGYLFLENTSEALPFNVIEVDTEAQLFALVKRKRVDAALVMRSHFLRQQRKELEGFKIVRRPLDIFNVYIGFSKTKIHKTVSDQFAHDMELFWDTPEYMALRNKYSNMQKKP